MNVGFTLRRYWRALTGIPSPEEAFRNQRWYEGYGFWHRFWASLLGIRLGPTTALSSMRGTADDDPSAVPVRPNPLTKPVVEGQRIRLPRFDRAALRLAATGERERLSVRWAATGWGFVLRESGPDQVDVLVEAEREVPATQVLSMRVTGPAGDHDFFMVFVSRPSGGSVGVLRLTGISWIDITVQGERAVAALDAGDPVVCASVADSVRATPDPAMPAWAEIVASRPAGDPLRQAIEDAAR